MFGNSDQAISTAGALTNSSDEDLLDIQHGGTTSEGGVNHHSINANPYDPNAGISSSYGAMPPGSGVPSFDDFPDGGLGQYDDFHTIDWQRDIARDRMRHRHIIKKKKDSLCDMIRGAHDAWSGWLCVLLVGLCSGVMAGIIDIGATWLTDLKFGICPSAFYLNKEQCCWSSNETVIDISGNCSLW